MLSGLSQPWLTILHDSVGCVLLLLISPELIPVAAFSQRVCWGLGSVGIAKTAGPLSSCSFIPGFLVAWDSRGHLCPLGSHQAFRGLHCRTCPTTLSPCHICPRKSQRPTWHYRGWSMDSASGWEQQNHITEGCAFWHGPNLWPLRQLLGFHIILSS